MLTDDFFKNNLKFSNPNCQKFGNFACSMPFSIGRLKCNFKADYFKPI